MQFNDFMDRMLNAFPNATVDEDAEGQVIVNTGWYRDPDDDTNLFLHGEDEPVVDTPVVSSSTKEVRMEQMGDTGIQALAEYIEEQLDSTMARNIVDEALQQAALRIDLDNLSLEQVTRIQYTMFGRALLHVAEQQFILAAGLVEE